MSVLQNFWNEVLTVWRAGVGGISVGDLVIALALLVVFAVLRGPLTRLVIGGLRRVANRSTRDFDDSWLDAMAPPLRFVFLVFGLYVGLSWIELPDDAQLIIDRLVRSLIAFTIFWTLYRIIEPLAFVLDRGFGLLGSVAMRDSVRSFAIKLIKIIIASLGIVAILEEWQFNVAAVLGGLGLVGMAVAFGAQNLIANLFAGVSIFLDRIFEIGDWIRTSDVEGTVEEIGFRTTKIRRFDKALVTLPNDKLASEAVINFSRMTNRRIYWMIGVEYTTPTETLRTIVQQLSAHVRGNDVFETDPARTTTLIHVDSFNSSSIDIMLYCFTKTTKWTEWMAIKEELALTIKEMVEGAGTGFAFPSTSLYLEKWPRQWPPGTPEAFPAPTAAASLPAGGSGGAVPPS